MQRFVENYKNHLEAHTILAVYICQVQICQRLSSVEGLLESIKGREGPDLLWLGIDDFGNRQFPYAGVTFVGEGEPLLLAVDSVEITPSRDG